MSKTPSSTVIILDAGARVRLSELGKARNPKQAAKIGTVLRRARTRNQLVVLFDGHTTPITFHRTYIEPLPPADGWKAL